jgi:Phosphoesterase family
VGQAEDAWDLDDMSHSHSPLVEKMNVINCEPSMDHFALVEESLHFTTAVPSKTAKQFGELTMAYIDGNTIPFPLVLCQQIRALRQPLPNHRRSRGYSDSQISEALVAKVVNAIANSEYWNNCAIIISWDDSEGTYDHVPPAIVAYDPNNTQLSRGPRVPLLVISPYAQTHIVSHEVGDTNSIIKFINLIFQLPALADLPDEHQALVRGKEIYNQDNLGPEDDPTTSVVDLTSAFSISRLRAHDVLPSSYVLIPDADITKLPQWGENPLKTHLHIIPTDTGKPNHIPGDFNPRPSSQPDYPN